MTHRMERMIPNVTFLAPQFTLGLFLGRFADLRVNNYLFLPSYFILFKNKKQK